MFFGIFGSISHSAATKLKTSQKLQQKFQESALFNPLFLRLTWKNYGFF